MKFVLEERLPWEQEDRGRSSTSWPILSWRSPTWLRHLFWVQEIGGSSPLVKTISYWFYDIFCKIIFNTVKSWRYIRTGFVILCAQKSKNITDFHFPLQKCVFISSTKDIREWFTKDITLRYPLPFFWWETHLEQKWFPFSYFGSHINNR